MRGSTTHYEAVANAAAGGLLDASSATGVPVIFGVLTTETMEQVYTNIGINAFGTLEGAVCVVHCTSAKNFYFHCDSSFIYRNLPWVMGPGDCLHIRKIVSHMFYLDWPSFEGFGGAFPKG